MTLLLVIIAFEGIIFLPFVIRESYSWARDRINGNDSAGLWPQNGSPEYLMEEFSNSVGTHYRLTHTPTGLVVSGTDKRDLRLTLDRRLRDLRSARLDSNTSDEVDSDTA